MPCVWSQSRGLLFQKLGREEGLSQGSVFAMVQDEDGFVWAGTQDGLNRFDGYQFKTYKHDPADERSIPDNWIRGMCIDREGTVWIGTVGGLARYDANRGDFQRVDLPRVSGHEDHDNYIFNLTALTEGGILVGTQVGFVVIDHMGQMRRIITNQRHLEQQPRAAWVLNFLEHRGQLWISTYGGGIYQATPMGDKLERIFPNNPKVDSVVSMVVDDQSQIWLATDEQGVARFDPATQNWTWYQQDPENSTSLAANGTIAIYCDQNGVVWVGTHGGLCRYNAEKDQFTTYRHDNLNPNSLSHNMVRSFLEDQAGNAWFGTNVAGIDLLRRGHRAFEGYQVTPNDDRGLRDNEVWSILVDHRKRLWIGTSTSLERLDPGADRFIHYPVGGEVGISHNILTSLSSDGNNRIWVGTYQGGLFRFVEEDSTFVRYSHDPQQEDSISSDFIVAMMRRKNGELWVGTRFGGINVYQSQQDGFRHIQHAPENPQSISTNDIRALFEDSKNRIWVGTMGEGASLQLEDGSYRHYGLDEGLSNATVLGIREDPAGRIWMATLDGLNLLDEANGTFQTFTEADGLPNNCISGLEFDQAGNLWLGTIKGAVCMNPRTYTMRNYFQSDGLQSDDITNGSVYRGPDGEIFMGGTSGLSVIHPHLLDQDFKAPKARLTDFQLFHRAVRIDETGEVDVLNREVSRVEQIILSPRSDVLTFTFAAPQAANPKRTRFTYHLDGFDRQWYEADASKRSVTYTNLPSGRYHFKVKAAAPTGPWGEELEVGVEVLSPFWATWWAYCLYVLIVAGIVVTYLWQQDRARRHLEARVEERTEQLNRKNMALDNRNRELETLDQIVRNINNETEPHRVLQVLTEQVRHLVGEADRVACMLLTENKESYRIQASSGFEDDKHRNVIFRRELVDMRYSTATNKVAEGVYVGDRFSEAVEGRALPGIILPKSLIAISLELDGKRVGYLIADNLSQAGIFSRYDPKMLLRLRQHAISALNKASSLRDLLFTQRELVEVARAAGMAETAVDVLHNLGNTLNSVKTVAQVVRESSLDLRGPQLLRKMADLLRQGTQQTDFLRTDERGKAVPDALVKIAERLEKQMNTICDETLKLDDHMQQVTSTLLAQQEHTREVECYMERIDLNQLLHQSLQNEVYLLKQKRVIVRQQLEPIPPVVADRARVKRILGYLLENAREAVADGGRLTLSSRFQENRALLSITDDGQGITGEEMERLFNPGFSTKDGHHGFGLHYCANTVKEMGGRIDVESEGSGKGTTVTLSFRLAKMT